MMNFEQEYLDACARGSDINEHLPTLSRLASECEHVTEMGICTGQSTRAFLRHDLTYVGYDYEIQNGIPELFEAAKNLEKNATFHKADTRQITIEETDLLFIDTLHHYEQLKEELRLHADKAKKYIVFHDTTLFENVNEGGGGRGLWPAIEEFLAEHSEWEIKERYTNNNGLTVLRRIN
jgi:hypothetical protein